MKSVWVVFQLTPFLMDPTYREVIVEICETEELAKEKIKGSNWLLQKYYRRYDLITEETEQFRKEGMMP